MCGIVYVKRLDHAKAAKQVAKRYSKQAHRGKDGFGYIGVKASGTISPLQRTQFEHEIQTKLGASSLTEILFHHRYPTSTPNVPEAAHPLLIANQELKHNYYVVHNGVISNDEALKEVHLKRGYTYQTEIKTQYRTRKGHVYTEEVVFNDSEAFAIELARTIEGLQPACMAEGAIAYIAYQVDKTSGKVLNVYFGTNGGNPLTMQWDKNFICIASEGGKAIEANKSFKLNADTNEVLEVNVKLQPIPTKRNMGYHTITIHNTLDGAREFTDTFGTERLHRPYESDYGYVDNTGYKKDEDKTLGELEVELEDIDEEIIGAVGDIQYSKESGDIEEADSYNQDYQNLITRRSKLQSLYERKANATA